MRRFQSYSLEEYEQWLSKQKISREINHIQIHHTWRPRKTDYKGESTILGMWYYHTNQRGWSDIGQHISIAPDGTIWDGRDLAMSPAGITGHNSGGVMIEIIGNFDVGEERLEGVQLDVVLGTVNALMERFKLTTKQIVFHREHASKSCPGTGIAKATFIQQVKDWSKKENKKEESKAKAQAQQEGEALKSNSTKQQEQENKKNTGFTDVPLTHYASTAIIELSRLGIIKGKPDGSFGLKEEITREDAAVMLYRLWRRLKKEMEK